MNIGSKNTFKSVYSIKKKKADNETLKNLNLKLFKNFPCYLFP